MNLKEKKNNENKSKVSKPLEQEQNHRRDHMEGYQQGSGMGREGGKRYKE